MTSQHHSPIYAWIFAAIVLMVIAGLWYFIATNPINPSNNPGSSLSTTDQSVQTSPPVSSTATPQASNASDLQALETELDQADLDTIDETLQQNEEDAATF